MAARLALVGVPMVESETILAVEKRRKEIVDELHRLQQKMHHFTKITELCDESIDLAADPARVVRIGQLIDLCRQAYKQISRDIVDFTEELNRLQRILECPNDALSTIKH